MNKVRLLKACETEYSNTRQNNRIDTNIFRQIENIQREDKIAFIGHSYNNNAKNINHESEDRRAVIRFLIEIIESGFEINTALLHQASNEYDIPYDDLYWNISHYVVIDKTVEWMCQNSNMPVEVYGNHWESNNIVKPYHNGMIEREEDLAEIFNSAKYVLITHPFKIDLQHIGEATACGCIPLVYDCRHSADEPHWDNNLMYFKTAHELRHIIEQQLGEPAAYVREDFNFTSVTKNRNHLMAARKNT